MIKRIFFDKFHDFLEIFLFFSNNKVGGEKYKEHRI